MFSFKKMTWGEKKKKRKRKRESSRVSTFGIPFRRLKVHWITKFLTFKVLDRHTGLVVLALLALSAGKWSTSHQRHALDIAYVIFRSVSSPTSLAWVSWLQPVSKPSWYHILSRVTRYFLLFLGSASACWTRGVLDHRDRVDMTTTIVLYCNHNWGKRV